MPQTLQQTTTDPFLHWRPLDTHRQVWVSLLWGHCSFLSGPGVHRFCFCPPRVCFPVLCKFWRVCGGVNGNLLQEGLCHTQICCIQSPCPCGSPLLTRTSTGDAQTQVCLSRGLWVLVHTRLVWALWASLAGMGFDSKCNIAPPIILLELLLCPWYFYLLCNFLSLYKWRSIISLKARALRMGYQVGNILFSSVQSLSRIQLFATPWIAARQASLSITNSQSLLKLMPIEPVMPSSHLILCHPLLLLPPIPPSIRVFSNESTLHMRWPKYWSFSISPSNEHPGLISFRMDWLDLLAVQGTLKSLLQHHNSKASVFWCSAIFTVPLSHPYMTTGKTIALTRWTFVGKVMSLLFNMLSRLVRLLRCKFSMTKHRQESTKVRAKGIDSIWSQVCFSVIVRSKV